MYKFTLYHQQNSPYKDRIKPIAKILEKINNKWNIIYEIIEIENLQPEQIELIKNSIRNISPQIRGKIVTSRNKTLPFSKSKNLNTKNTPILILYQNKTPINVYPHMLGTTYFQIESQLETILENGPEAYITAKGLLEEPTQKILADNPSILEEGMQFKEANKDVGFGVADILLKDSKGKIVVVEIETKATETAVAQVSRLAAGYANQNNLPKNNVRKVILCQHFDNRTVKTCEGASVELYKLTTEKIC